MPAAAVIPAPIAYIKVVAVKTLVVGFWWLLFRSVVRQYFYDNCSFLNVGLWFDRHDHDNSRLLL